MLLEAIGCAVMFGTSLLENLCPNIICPHPCEGDSPETLLFN